jgi:hypothetical protein
MSAMGVDQPVFGHLPQPEVERHHGIGQIAFESSVGFDHHFLRDVARVDALLYLPIHPQVDHSPHRLSMAFQEAIDRRVVAAAGVGKQLLGIFGIRPHGALTIEVGRTRSIVWPTPGGNGRNCKFSTSKFALVSMASHRNLMDCRIAISRQLSALSLKFVSKADG